MTTHTVKAGDTVEYEYGGESWKIYFGARTLQVKLQTVANNQFTGAIAVIPESSNKLKIRAEKDR